MIKIFIILFIILTILFFFQTRENFTDEGIINKEFIIIGAGPAGLQTGYFLNKFKKDYLILEKSNTVGNFFTKFPIHRKLISINKVYTGNNNKDFNLRHDWNSLLSNDNSLLFKNYSKEFFPPADVYVKYLIDYFQKNKLNVKFNVNVKEISKDSENYFVVKTNEKTYRCKKLILATGLFKPHTINVDGAIKYIDLNLEKKKFENKKILIIGQGNSAFEVADHLIDTTALIHILGRDAIKFAWQTHYAGDLRAVNNNFLDTYQLKTQNGIISLDLKYFNIKKINNKYFIIQKDNKLFKQTPKEQIPKDGYDFVIDCTGFTFDDSIFNKKIKPKTNGKVPIIKPNFESENVSNLFMAGTLMQYISWKKSSGAFVHGFRYLIRSLVRMETDNLKKYIINSKDMLVDKILYRINNSSGLYQMFGCLVDIVIILEEKFIYIEEIPKKLVESEFVNKYDILMIELNYGKFGGHIRFTKNLEESSYVFGLDSAMGIDPELSHKSNFLHPILWLYKNKKFVKKHHISEHLLTEYKLVKTHILPLKKFIFNNL
jgi:thioredoxin reductase